MRNSGNFRLNWPPTRRPATFIQHTGGLRKVRFKLAGRGKSGSARVIYLWLPHVRALILFHFYTKQAKSSLSAADKKALRTAAQIIKQCYQP